jgi:MFS family permease
MGAVGGALGVVITTFLQTRTPEHVRGRVMALVAFALLALDPASLALAGLLVPFGAAVVLVVPGVAFLVLAILGLRPGVRRRAAV